MNLDLQAKGASFIATQTQDNPRSLVIEVLKTHADVEVKAQFEEFRRLVEDGGDAYQRAIDWYFFVNMRDYLINSRNRHNDPVERTAAKLKHREIIEQIKAQIVMLDLTMPNGKAMRDCTGAEMAKFGNRYQKISARVGKSGIVGEVLNEEQVRDIIK